jgi:hypothetical protein
MSDVVRDELQIAIGLATGINKQRWINVLAALDAEREEHAQAAELLNAEVKRKAPVVEMCDYRCKVDTDYENWMYCPTCGKLLRYWKETTR